MTNSDRLPPHTPDCAGEPNKWNDFLLVLRWRGVVDVHSLNVEIQEAIQELLGIGRPKKEYSENDRIRLWNLVKLRLALIEVEAPNFTWPLESALDIVREHEAQAINQWRTIGTRGMDERNPPRNLTEIEFIELSTLLDEYRDKAAQFPSRDLIGNRLPMLFGRQPDAELIPRATEPYQALRVATVGRGMLDIPTGPRAHELLQGLQRALSATG